VTRFAALGEAACVGCEKRKRIVFIALVLGQAEGDSADELPFGIRVVKVCTQAAAVSGDSGAHVRIEV
jgi:hypothetical protein